MTTKTTHKLLTVLIAAVWLVNGLYCKVLNQVPRHQNIVASMLGDDHARLLTLLIGVAEVVMAVWIISRYRSRLNAIVQIAVIATMNILEFFLVPDLLLWGGLNSLFAFLFICVVGYNEFVLSKSLHIQVSS